MGQSRKPVAQVECSCLVCILLELIEEVKKRKRETREGEDIVKEADTIVKRELLIGQKSPPG
jgi:hypothetical protein